MSVLATTLWALMAKAARVGAELPPVESFPVFTKSEASVARSCIGRGSTGASSTAAVVVARCGGRLSTG